MKSEPNQVTNVTAHIWPNGETPCIWMQAGLVEYKLCDRRLDCDNCPFHALMSGDRPQLSSKERHLRKIRVIQKNKGKAPEREDIWQSYRQIFFDPQAHYGMRFWYVKPVAEHVAQIGLDDLAVMFLPAVREVILPRCNTKFTPNQTCVWLVCTEGTIPLTIPFAGRVVRINDRILDALNHPQIPQRGNLWLFEYDSQELPNVISRMQSGSQTAAYLLERWQAIVDNLEQALYRHRHLLGQTSQDGGQRVQGIEQMLGEKEYFSIIAGIFTE